MRTLETLKWLIRGVLGFLLFLWLIFGFTWTYHYVRGGRERAEAYLTHVSIVGRYDGGSESGHERCDAANGHVVTVNIDPVRQVHRTYESLIVFLLLTWFLVELHRLVTRIQARRSRGSSSEVNTQS